MLLDATANAIKRRKDNDDPYLGGCKAGSLCQISLDIGWRVGVLHVPFSQDRPRLLCMEILNGVIIIGAQAVAWVEILDFIRFNLTLIRCLSIVY